MKKVFALLALGATLLSGPAVLTPTVVPLGIGALALTGCFEDACDKVKDDCRDKGLVPTNCKEDKTAISDKCECECVSPQN